MEQTTMFYKEEICICERRVQEGENNITKLKCVWNDCWVSGVAKVKLKETKKKCETRNGEVTWVKIIKRKPLLKLNNVKESLKIISCVWKPNVKEKKKRKRKTE